MDLNDLIAVGNVPQYTDAQLEGMKHNDLLLLRKYAVQTKNPELNARLAPFEHQAFAREYTKNSPVSGTLGLGAAIPLYALGKSIPGIRDMMATGGDPVTPPTLAQVVAGYRGIGQGLGVIK